MESNPPRRPGRNEIRRQMVLRPRHIKKRYYFLIFTDKNVILHIERLSKTDEI